MENTLTPTCYCPEFMHSLDQLCDSCRAEYNAMLDAEYASVAEVAREEALGKRALEACTMT